jgi:glycosyltransferase involved in cell wall biosynthesis
LLALSEVLRDDENAILVRPDDLRALAEGIIKVLSDAYLARRISERAYSEARQYGWEKRASRILELIVLQLGGSEGKIEENHTNKSQI